jgi:hypothetical protein
MFVRMRARAHMWPTGQIRGLIMVAARCVYLELIKVQVRQNNLIPTEKEQVENLRTPSIPKYSLLCLEARITYNLRNLGTVK